MSGAHQNGEGRVNFLVRVNEEKYAFNMAEALLGHSWCSQIQFCFNYYFGDSATYFFEIIMLISLKGTLTQTFDRVTFLCKGPMRR